MCHIYSLTQKDFIIKEQTIVLSTVINKQPQSPRSHITQTISTLRLQFCTFPSGSITTYCIASEGVALTVTFFFINLGSLPTCVPGKVNSILFI